MKPIKIAGTVFDADALSIEAIDALIEKLEEAKCTQRRKKAEEYAEKIHNLIIEAKQQDLNVMIDNEWIPDDFRVDVYI